MTPDPPGVSAIDIATDALRALEEVGFLREMLSHARSFAFTPEGGEWHDEIRVEWRDAERWAVCRLSGVLNTDGEWEYEPNPSSRDDAFKQRCRFSFAEAVKRARELVEAAS